MKDLKIYQKIISRIYSNCEQMELPIQIDWDKVESLVQQWIECNDTSSLDEIDVFCNNVEHILKQEIELRIYDKSLKGAIWLTK